MSRRDKETKLVRIHVTDSDTPIRVDPDFIRLNKRQHKLQFRVFNERAERVTLATVVFSDNKFDCPEFRARDIEPHRSEFTNECEIDPTAPDHPTEFKYTVTVYLVGAELEPLDPHVIISGGGLAPQDDEEDGSSQERRDEDRDEGQGDDDRAKKDKDK